MTDPAMRERERIPLFMPIRWLTRDEAEAIYGKPGDHLKDTQP